MMFQLLLPLIIVVVLLPSFGSCVLVQYTPDQADWSTFATKPFTSGTNTGHDPNGVGWISNASWIASAWDGTIYNPSKMTKSELSNAICPSVDRIRGIREVFYQHNPFADNMNPTKAEVDNWHRIALNHARALIGYTTADRLVKPDICMHARALWGDQRKHTTMWDAAYPGTTGSAFGPCQGSSNGHCGATFLPSAADQAPYLPAGHAACNAVSGAEGVFSGPKSNIPWSLKWSRGLCNTLLTEGFWGGHTGPFFHREKFGFSFWDSDPSNNNNNAGLRAKWTGNLMPSLYCNPSDPACDVDATGPGTTAPSVSPTVQPTVTPGLPTKAPTPLPTRVPTASSTPTKAVPTGTSTSHSSVNTVSSLMLALVVVAVVFLSQM